MVPQSLRNFLSSTGGILIGLVGFLLTIFLLNYLGIVPLSRLYPRQFGFLPQRGALPTQQVSLKTTQAPGQTVFPCPIKKFPCPPADILTKSTVIPNFQGLGYQNLSSNTDVLAVASGQYQVQEATQSSKGKDNINIILFDTNNEFEVSYLLTGKTDLKGEGTVSEGQVIGTLSGKTRGEKQFGNKYNLIIYVRSLINSQILNLTPFEDGINVGESP